MTDQPKLPVATEALLNTVLFLLEIAFAEISGHDPLGASVGLQKIEADILGMLERGVANPFPANARDVQISDEIELQLRDFLGRVRARIDE